jgi:hypothetical protein
MNGQNQKLKTTYGTLSDLKIVSPELSNRILASVSVGAHSIRESYLYRCSHSLAEYAAACEMAETLGLTLH